jgi:hypothetical protein
VLSRTGVSSAEITLTWEGEHWDMVEAIVIDGVLDECSIDNSAWRALGGVGLTLAVSSCFKPCSRVTGFGGTGRLCLNTKLALGAVYDVLLSSRANPEMLRALRVRAPWVHNAGRCLVSEGTATVCGGLDITWHGGLLSMGSLTQMGTVGTPITRLNETMGSNGVTFSSTKVSRSNDMADLEYLTLDHGMRVTRIVTINTFDDIAMQKLKDAKTREELLIICMRDHSDSCVLTEHMQLSNSDSVGHPGWSFEQLEGSPVRANSGLVGSVLWVAESKSKDECYISVGSWLLGSTPLNIGNGIAALFTQSISQICHAPGVVVLVRPGFAWPKLVRGSSRIQWSFTFIELQDIDELGVPVRRR